jgi:hypothetical protein
LQWKNLQAVPDFRVFAWSGANSVFERDAAAANLALDLSTELASSDCLPVVIAHSHGGNVALRAMTYLGENAKRVRVITIATPFLRIYPSKSGRPHTEATKVIFFSIILSIILLLNSWHDLSMRDLPTLVDYMSLGVVYSCIGLVIASALAAWLAAVVIVGTNLNHVDFRTWSQRPFGVARLAALVENWTQRPFKIYEASDYNIVGTSKPRLLVLRGVDDEAAMTLAFGAIGVRLGAYFSYIVDLLSIKVVALIYTPLVLFYAFVLTTILLSSFGVFPHVHWAMLVTNRRFST